MSVFLSELHYDNIGTDSGEFIEITGVAGTDLANYELYLYNGNDGTVYASYDLSGVVIDQGTGFGAITVDPSSLQNGSPDGLALVDASGNLIEFLSYEGSFVAVGGPADGIASIDIGVAESSSTPIGYSLQKQSGIWSGPAPASPAQVNEAASSGGTAGITLIHQIQADGFLSPLIGESVTIEAIVVGDFQGTSGLNGFYLQEEDGDADLDLKTSEGIFIFDGLSFLVDVNLGDLIRVTGTVKEFSELTELDAIRDIEIVSAANSLPTATVLRFPLTDQAQLEAVEGMRVTIPDRLYVTEYFNLDRFGEIRLASDGPGNSAGTDPRLDTFTQFNPPDATGYAAHLDAVALRQILLDDGSSIQNPPTLIYGRSGNPISRSNTIRGGDHINDLSGILSQGFGSYRIQRSEGVDFQAANARPTTPPAVGGTLQVGSLNVLNLFATLDTGSALTALGLEPRGAESQEELDRQLEKLVTTIHTMDVDVLALVELENDFLPGSPGNALELLVQRLNATSAAGTYAWVMPTSRFVGDDAIAVGFLYKTAEVRLTPGTKVATLTDAILPDLGLSGLPPVFDGPATNRSPLAVTFSEVESGRSFTLVANHFKSKGSVGTAGAADEDALDGAGFANQTRVNAARALESWLATDPTGSGDPDVLVLGDLNAYAREEPIAHLEAAGFVNLADRFLGAGAYSFVFDGQSGTLDYALASPSLLSQISGTAEWHINADEPDAIDYNLNFGRDPSLFDGTTPFRSSDHDPVIVGLQLAEPALPPMPSNALILSPIGSYASGQEGVGEIVAYDPITRRLFSLNGENDRLDVLDITDPTRPALVSTIDLSAYGAAPNSVAVRNGIVAVAMEADPKTDPGTVVFFTTAGDFQSQVVVGAQPDMLTFTPDGTKVLVANEGEPNEGDTINPQGSLSLIDLSGGVLSPTVTTADFSAFDGQEAKLRGQGVRISAGKTFSVDAEPEYIAIAPDGSSARVTLQENNALAVLDLTSGKITAIQPLGLKDYATGIPSVSTYDFDEASLPVIGTTPTGQQLKLGGFSGLFFEGIDAASGDLLFLTNTDRGPNGEPSDLLPAVPGNERPFALPEFAPELVRFRLNAATDEITITERIALTQADGNTPLSGLPNLQAGNQGSAYTDEVGVDLNGIQLPNDPFGADLEGVVVAPDGTFWLPDEYRPAIYHFAADGRLLERLIPIGTAAAAGAAAGSFGSEVLPAVYGETRRANRGFEAIALDGTKIYAFIQTNLDNPGSAVRGNGVIRILEFDAATAAVTGEYVYVMRDTTAPGSARTDKIGDAVALGGGRFLVAERDDRTGPDANKLIYEINLAGATDVLGTPIATATGGTTLESLSPDQLAAAGIRPVDKRLVVNAAAIGYTGVGKLEGLAVVDGDTLAVLNDNDFQLAGPIAGDGSAPINPSPEPIRLGLIDFSGGNGLDASDRDVDGSSAAGGRIAIGPQPVFGMFMPDGVAAFTAAGRTYYITANEGDDRDDFITPNETIRVGASSYVLDPATFPAAAALKNNAVLGRLTVSAIDGDIDGDGDFDRIQAYGARSFTIWDEAGNRIFDSADAIERITAAQVPALFNSDGAADSFDSRSDNKGPEPESVAIGTIGGRPYAFIALERVGGILTYDLSDPLNPVFVTYTNPAASPIGTPGQSDRSPEGIIFIPAADSPTGQPLLVTGNEVSGSTTIYSLSTLPNGVASGDGDQNSIVLWTRSTALGQVRFEYATTADFTQIAGTAAASVTNPLQPVKVEVEGLTPATDYYYRVIDAAGSVAEGRFTTAAALGQFTGLHFGVSGDWRGEIAPYPSIDNAAGENLDFFVALGDTIYADVGSPGLLNPDGSRKDQATTLDEFRAKHNEVYSARYGLNTLADLRGSTTIYAGIDDHEVTNDFAGGAPAASDPRFGSTQGLINDTDLFENGLAAFQEYNPIRDVFYGNTGDLRTAGERDLYRFNTFGSDAATFLLDARSFRDPELVAPDTTNPADVARFLSESLTLERTMLGAAQLSQLKADLLTAQQSDITWKFVMVPEPIQELGIYNTDAYEGYAKERTDLLKFIEANDIRNVVFVAADIHGTVVNNLTYTEVPGGPRIATDAWEITTGSVGYSKPFGQTVVDIATAGGLLTQQEKAFYDTLPIAPDGDDLPNDKDDFLKAAFQNLAIGPAGYDPIGLNSNLSSSSGVVGSFDIQANLLQGDYVAAHTYGWTQFSIDGTTQELTVTTYGIDPYSEVELLNDTSGVLARTPRIVSQFTVDPQITMTTQPIVRLAADRNEFNGGPSVELAKGFGTSGYPTESLYTIGESSDLQITGIPDGQGAFRIDSNTIRLLVNSEIGSTAGYSYQLASGVALTGARVNFIDLNNAGQVVSGDLAYDTVYDRDGNLVTDSAQIGGGFQRFCSANLIEAGTSGVVDRLFLLGEETTAEPGGTMWILDVDAGALWAAPDLGYGSWESATVLDTGSPDKVAYFLGDDASRGPLYLYVGTKNPGGNVLERNGLVGGQLYFWKSDSGITDHAAAIANGLTQGNTASGSWVAIDVQDASGSYKSGNTLRDEVQAAGGFLGYRVEDVDTNPNSPNQLAFNTTGGGGGSDIFGSIWTLDVSFTNGDPATATLKHLYDGDAAGNQQAGVRSPDNLVWSADGNLYVQEDRSTPFTGEEASIFRVNASTGIADRILQVDRNAALPTGQTDTEAGNLGAWETSGIIDVSNLYGNAPGTDFFFNVQAHGVTGGAIDAFNLVEGGQIIRATVAQPRPYTLQILSYYGESGLLGVETAPILGALIDRFDDQFAHTLVLGEGDSYIPGPWLVAGADPSLNGLPAIGSTALGRPDIAIMNAFGTDASALGNHEFDLGSPVLQGALAPSGKWSGARFPFITANLDFSADSFLRGLADAGLGGTATNSFAGQEVSTLAGKIAPYAISTQGGERIGLIGITTFELLIKSSPNGTVPKDDGDPATSDLEEVALYVQNAVNALRTLGVDKIVMVDQLDTIERNRQLAPLVSGVDVMVAGGGHERLGDADDVPAAFPGHDATFVDTFPIVTAGADGKPVLIVTTDTEYTYLGRLVVDFNAAGEILTANLDPAINGAYAATEATLQAAYGSTSSADEIVAASTIGSQVKAITAAINDVIVSKDGNIFGYTNVYLEGDRVFGRTQEVNLGDITADANLAKALAALPSGTVLASLKNGGGIRASIGSVGESGEKLPPAASFVKPAGAISQLDIENALRFDNKLMVFDSTPQQLLNILEFAAGLSSGPAQQSGGYAQVGGIHFSYDPSLPVGARVRDVAVYDLEGRFVARVVDDGKVLPQAPASISLVTLNFTANGGDGYPIKANGDNFRYLLADGGLSAPVDESLDFTAAATVPANALGEQAAFAAFLETFHGTPETAYAIADTPAALDQRIQNLQAKLEDTVLPASLLSVGGVEIPGGSSLALTFPGNETTAVALLARIGGGQPGTPAEVLATVPGAASGLPAGFPPALPSAVLGADGGSGAVEFLLQDLATGATTPLQVSNSSPAGFTLQGPGGALIRAEVLPPARTPEVFTTSLTVGGESLPGVGFDGLTGVAPGADLQLRLELELFREAAFDNVVGFYLAEAATGNVLDPITGTPVAGGQFGADPAAYAAAVLAGSLWSGSVPNQSTATLSGTITIGSGVDLADAVLLPYLQVEGGSTVYGPGTGSNSDRATHVQLLGSNTFGFEDLPSGGDNDFDDVILVVRDLSAIALASGI